MEKKLKEMIEYSVGGILSKEILKTEKLDGTLFCMAKDTELSEHTSTRQGFVYVLEGNGVFNLEGKEIIMKEGVFIFMKKNMIHSLKAKENMTFLLTLVN